MTHHADSSNSFYAFLSLQKYLLFTYANAMKFPEISNCPHYILVLLYDKNSPDLSFLLTINITLTQMALIKLLRRLGLSTMALQRTGVIKPDVC